MLKTLFKLICLVCLCASASINAQIITPNVQYNRPHFPVIGNENVDLTFSNGTRFTGWARTSDGRVTHYTGSMKYTDGSSDMGNWNPSWQPVGKHQYISNETGVINRDYDSNGNLIREYTSTTPQYSGGGGYVASPSSGQQPSSGSGSSSHSATCRGCNGSGYCQHCGGSGYVNNNRSKCSLCHGTGRCVSCAGVGKIYL